MAIFYFDIQLGSETYRDEFGDAFDTLKQAIAHAQALLPDLARDHVFGDGNCVACELRDEGGQVQYRAELVFSSIDKPSTNLGC